MMGWNAKTAALAALPARSYCLRHKRLLVGWNGEGENVAESVLESSRHCRGKQRRRSTLRKFSTVFQSLCSGTLRLRTLTSRHELL
jgi:hypothetical protein